MSILEDYDHDNIPPVDDETTFVELMKLDLLGSTALGSIDFASLDKLTINSTELKVALEGIGGAIHEKIMKISEKIKDTFVKINLRIKEKLRDIIVSITKLGSKASNETLSDATKTDHVATATEYPIVKAALAAASSAVGIVKQIPVWLSNFRDEESIQKGLQKMRDLISGIKWPFGEITTNSKDEGTKISVSIPGIVKGAKSASIRTLQWTATTAATLSSMAARLGNSAVSAGGSVLSAAQPLVEGATTFAKGLKQAVVANHAANKYDDVESGKGIKAGLYIGGLTVSVFSVCIVSVIVTMFKLMQGIILGSLRLLRHTFHALTRAVPTT